MTKSHVESTNGASRGSATITIRIFGVLSIFLALTGLLLEAKTIIRIGFLSNTNEAPFALLAFYLMSGINFTFMVLLAVGGYWLVRYRSKGITFCNFVLAGELVYLFVIIILPFNGPVGHSINVATGIGNVAIMVQAIIAYPIIALIGLTLSRRHLRKINASPLAQ